MTPAWDITLDGESLAPLIADRLLKISITDESGLKSDTFSMELDNRDMVFGWPSKGAVVTVALGYKETGIEVLGTYTVDERTLRGKALVLSLSGKAADMTADSRQKNRRTESYHGQTVRQIVATIAARHGLTPVVGADYSDEVIAHVDQTSESDLAFLTRQAATRGAVAKISDGKLLFVAAGTAKSASGKTLTPTLIAESDVTGNWEYQDADRGKKKAVVAAWWDAEAAQHREVKIGGGSDEDVHELPQAYASEAEARAAAQAASGESSAGEGSLTLTVTGKPTLLAETPVTITGFPSVIPTDWIVKTAKHELTRKGYTCALTCARTLEKSEET